MATKRITAMYARAHFGDLLDRVRISDDSYIITRHGKDIAVLQAVPLAPGRDPSRGTGGQAKKSANGGALPPRAKGTKSKRQSSSRRRSAVDQVSMLGH